MQTKPLQLKGLFNLGHRIELYIPSTINTNQETNTEAYKLLVMGKFSQYFGGSTTTESMGSWVSNNGQVITEKITIVFSYATSESVTQHMDEVIKLAIGIKKDLNQEAISLVYDNELYLI
jgi:hypothetical protein